MALGSNNQYNNKNERNVNTKIKTFFSDMACFQMQYWNDSISLKINPLQSVSPEGLRQYDYTRRANTALSSEKCIALAKMIEENMLNVEIDPDMIDININVGVSSGKNGGAVFIEYKKDDKGVLSYFITVYTVIDQSGKASKDNTFTYKFQKVPVIKNYNPDEGTYDETFEESEFLFFYDKLKKISDISGTSAHSINSDNAYKTNTSFTSAPSMPSNNSAGSYSAPVSTFSSDEDLPF